MTRTMKNRYIGFGIIAACVFLYAITFTFQGDNVSLGISDYGPAFFPRVLAIVIFFLSVILIVGAGKTAKDESADAGNHIAEKEKAGRLVLSILGMTLVYLMTMKPVGYFISTAAYTFLSILLLRPKRHLHILWLLAGSIAFTFGLQYLFGTVMNVLLPPGILK